MKRTNRINGLGLALALALLVLETASRSALAQQPGNVDQWTGTGGGQFLPFVFTGGLTRSFSSTSGSTIYILNGGVTNSKIANGAVTNPKLANGAVTFPTISWPLAGSIANNNPILSLTNNGTGPGILAQSSQGDGVDAFSANSTTAAVHAINTAIGTFANLGTLYYGVEAYAPTHNPPLSAAVWGGSGWGTVGTLADALAGVHGSGANGIDAGRFDGNVTVTGSITQSSDARFKTNVTTFPNALDKILALRGVSFDWRRSEFPEKNFSKGRHPGFIAQEMEKVLPELVSKDKQGYRSVDYSGVVPVLVEAVKQQQKEIDTLKADNAALKVALGHKGRTGIVKSPRVAERSAVPWLAGTAVLGLCVGGLRRRTR